MAIVPIVSAIQPPGYRFLRYGICGDGPVRSVLLLAESELPEIDTVLVDTTSRSSIVLLKVLLASLSKRAITYTPVRPELIPSLIGGRTAGLLIADHALEAERSFSFRYDLSEQWKKLSGLPICFAVWAHRGTSSGENGVIEMLADQLESGVARGGDFARRWALCHGADPETAAEYVTQSLRYRITPEIAAGTQEFLRRAQALSLLESELTFAKQLAL